MTSFGRQILAQTGTAIAVSADGAPEWKTGGITIDWSTVIAAAADTDPGDGNIIKAGHKGLKYGTVLTRITASGKYAPWTSAETSTTLGANVAIGATTLTITSTTNLFPGDSITLGSGGGGETVEVATVVDSTHVTLVSAATKTHTSGDAVAKPDDGRQTLSIGNCGVLNETVLQDGPIGFGSGSTDHPGLIVGGRVWSARLQVGGTDQPTLAALLAAMPRLVPVIS